MSNYFEWRMCCDEPSYLMYSEGKRPTQKRKKKKIEKNACYIENFNTVAALYNTMYSVDRNLWGLKWWKIHKSFGCDLKFQLQNRWMRTNGETCISKSPQIEHILCRTEIFEARATCFGSLKHAKPHIKTSPNELPHFPTGHFTKTKQKRLFRNLKRQPNEETKKQTALIRCIHEQKVKKYKLIPEEL